MIDPFALTVIDAARLLSDAWLDPSDGRPSRHMQALCDTVSAYDAAHPTTRHTLADGTTVRVEGGGVTVR